MDWIPIIAILTISSGIGIIIDKFLNEQDIKRIKNSIFTIWYRLSDEQFKFSHEANQLHNTFNELFDKIYGRKHFSPKCFLRSILSSLLSVCLLYLIALVFFPVKAFGPLGIGPFQFLSHESWITFVRHDYIILLYIFVNFIVDYFSLIETRYFLKKSANRHFLIKISFLFIDLLISFILVIVLYLTYYQLYSPAVWSHTGGHINQYLLSLGLSTLVTSILFYLFILFYFLLKGLDGLRTPIRSFLERLDSLKNPVTSIVGIIGGILVIIKGLRDLL
tara:strand:- start:341 stop:1171 length:831 start_codon:yes stop_codon:yes gene_type:complete